MLVIHIILNICVDIAAFITIPLYIYFFAFQLKLLIKRSSHDEISPVFTIILMWNGFYDIYSAIIIFIFIELPQLGVALNWYMENDRIKGKILSMTELCGAPSCLFVILIMAINRYTAVKLPIKYNRIWTVKNTMIIFIGIWTFILISHGPITLYAQFYADVASNGSNDLHFYYTDETKEWNQIYNYFDTILSFVILIPSIILYVITGNYIIKNLNTFKSNEKKMLLVKLTIISIFICIAFLLCLILQLVQTIAWLAFSANVFDIDTFYALLRIFMHIKYLSVPWITIFLFPNMRNNLFPCFFNPQESVAVISNVTQTKLFIAKIPKTKIVR